MVSSSSYILAMKMLYDKRRQYGAVKSSLSLHHFAPTSHFIEIPNMFGKGTLIAAGVLGFCAPVLPMTITGPSSAQVNGPITFTWTSVSTDPTIFEIDIDKGLNSLSSSDGYFIQHNSNTASGSITVTPPALSVGTHRIAFSSNDGFQILAQGSIEILAAGSPSSSSSSSTPSSSTAPASASPTRSSSSSSASPLPHLQLADLKTDLQNITAMPARSSGVLSGHHGDPTSAPGRASAAARQGSPGKIPQFLVSSLSSAHTGAHAVHNGSDNIVFRSLEDNETSAVSPRTPAVSSASMLVPTISTRTTAGFTDRKQPANMRRDRPVVPTTQPDPGPSREQLLQEVQRLREQIEAVSPPPSYVGV
ncbi:hypothetical protein B0H13DRAFT_1912966 [Mycena leptocephala]|nr:hypothetical protein B0H13DRAFT_1912966 [Mycena leptocephala]